MLISRSVILKTDDSTGVQLNDHSLLADEIQEGLERFQEYGYTSHPPDNSEALVVFPMGNRDHGICIAVDNRSFRLKALEKGEVAIYTDEGDSVILKRGNNIEINGSTSIKNTTTTFTINCTDAIVNSTSTTVNSETTDVNATTTATVTSPLATVNASTQTDIISPIINLTGNVNVAGNLSVSGPGASMSMNGTISLTGSMTATGDLADSGGSLDSLRTTYNSHTHDENGDGGGITDPPNQTA